MFWALVIIRTFGLNFSADVHTLLLYSSMWSYNSSSLSKYPVSTVLMFWGLDLIYFIDSIVFIHFMSWSTMHI